VFDRVAEGIAGGVTAPAGDTDKSHPPLPAFESDTKSLLAGNLATQIAFLNVGLTLYPPYDAARTEALRALALDPTSTEAKKLLEKLPPAAASLKPVSLTSFRTDT